MTRGRTPGDGPTVAPKRHVHDVAEVEDKPYTRKPPITLPAQRIMFVEGKAQTVSVLPLTEKWWDTVRAMPHCVLWTPADWMFAVETALIADLSFRGITSAGSELRQRERILGTTLEARRNLRIRYVKPEKAETKKRGATKRASSKVTSLDERRARIPNRAS